MKKYIFILLAMTFALSTGFAQDAKSDFKKAKKSLRKYRTDQTANLDALISGGEMMKTVVKSPDYSESVRAWMLKGQIENELAARDMAQYQISPTFVPQNDEEALDAKNSFMKAFEYSIKKYNKGDALKGMAETARYLNANGLALYQSGKYVKAYHHFNSLLKVDKLLKENDMKAVLAKQEDVNNQLYITGVSAMSGDMLNEAVVCFKQMLDQGDKRAVIYEAMFKYFKDSDEEKAVQYLNEGRAAFPDESALLFAEINYYLGKGEMGILVDKLKMAREKEPNNVSIVTTEANVYDNLYQKAEEAGDVETTDKYFDLAKKTYEEALMLDSTDFIATYSLGALYYNKAAARSKDVNVLADDYSNEGAKKYEAKKKEMEDLFDMALPYFEGAEILNGNDKNTLIALKEIYARKNMFEKSGIYKAKIEALK